MKKGFYYISDVKTEMCYYLSENTEGNKVIDFKKRDSKLEWKSLTNVPEESILRNASYHILNPTNCMLK